LLVQPGHIVDSELLIQRGENAHGHALERSREVVHDVPSVCDLHRAWSTPRRSAGVDSISVAADDFHAWMIVQPPDQRVG